jgi:hypothetical protein
MRDTTPRAHSEGTVINYYTGNISNGDIVSPIIICAILYYLPCQVLPVDSRRPWYSVVPLTGPVKENKWHPQPLPESKGGTQKGCGVLLLEGPHPKRVPRATLIGPGPDGLHQGGIPSALFAPEHTP